MSARQGMLASLNVAKSGFSLPRSFYIDADYFQLDMEMIWYREWLFAAHECELSAPGSYVTLQLGDYPIVILRDKEGQIRAFHNSCRHRGSRVCTAEKGKASRLVCPYHQWVYNLDGSLMSARHMGPDLDKSRYGLKPVGCEAVEGYIFINVAEHPESFEPVRRLVAPYIEPYGLKDVKIAHETTIIEQGNWKLVWENNRECYHCIANHPQLCKVFPEDPTSSGNVGSTDPELDLLWRECESVGLPSRYQADSTFQYRVVRSALVGDASSYTESGRPAVNRPLADSLNKEQIGALLLYHYPSTWNHFLRDHAVTFRVLPISPTETALTTKWIVHKDAVEGVDYDLADLTHVWTETNSQDRHVVEENARGVRSPAYEPGPYSTSQEDGVIQFVDWYTSLMGPRLAGGGRSPLRNVA